MMLIEETAVPDAVLPVEEFKTHLRLGTGFAPDALQDEVLVSFLRAALAAIEARSGKVLLERAFSWTVNLWRDAKMQAFPVAPINEISAVNLVSSDGTEMPVASNAYWLEKDTHRPRLRATGATLPYIPQAGSVKISFAAGYGAAWADIPADLRQAVMLLAAHYYEYRDETSLSDGCMPFGVSSLIERYKVLRIWTGGGA